MPIVDVICVSDKHDIDEFKLLPRFFQIKATTGAMVRRRFYFSRRRRYIHVGSKRYGRNVHLNLKNKREDDETYNDINVGYICIQYHVDRDNNLIFNNKKSFFISPPLSYFLNYKYINNNLIRFRSDTHNITELTDDRLKFPSNEVFNEREIRNPFERIGGFVGTQLF